MLEQKQLQKRFYGVSYTFVRMGEHNVVIALMPEIRNKSAAIVATQLLNEFTSIKLGLLEEEGRRVGRARFL